MKNTITLITYLLFSISIQAQYFSGEGVEIDSSNKLTFGGLRFNTNKTIDLGTKSLLFNKVSNANGGLGDQSTFLKFNSIMPNGNGSSIIESNIGLGHPTDVPMTLYQWNNIQSDGSNNNTTSWGLNTNVQNPNMIGMGIFLEPNWIYGGVPWIENHYELRNINDTEYEKTNIRLWSSQYQHRATRQLSTHQFDFRGNIWSFSDLFSNEKIIFNTGGNNSTTVGLELAAIPTSKINIQSASANLWLFSTPNNNQSLDFNGWENVHFHSFYDSKQYDAFVFKKNVLPNSNNDFSIGAFTQRHKNIWAHRSLNTHVGFGETIFFAGNNYTPPAHLYGVAVGNTKDTKLVSFRSYNNTSAIMEILENNAIIMNLPTYGNNQEALNAGLLTNQLYKTPNGQLMVTLPPIN